MSRWAGEKRRGAAAEAVERLARRAEAGRLSYYGVDRDSFPLIVEAVMGRAELQNTPDPPSEGEAAGRAGTRPEKTRSVDKRT